MDNFFFEISLVIIASSILGIIAKALKQPVILAYILAGVLIGPLALNLIPDPHLLKVISEVGITLLLFLIGIELNFRRFKELGKMVIIIGITQIILTMLAGFFIAFILGFTFLVSFYIGMALAFSSTIVGVKLLSEKHDIDSLYGQIVVGILILQDIAAIFIIILLTTEITNPTPTILILNITLNIIKCALLVTVTLLLSKYVLGYIFRFIAQSQELLVFSSLAWCFIFSLLFELLGLSKEIGAFIAGISLASLPYHYDIRAKVQVLRDFFISLFFASLGSQLVLITSYSSILPLFIFTIFVLVLKPFIVILLTGLTGYQKRTSFLSGLTLAQVSEFSLIKLALGLQLGHIPNEIVSIITIVAVLTFIISTYLTEHNDKIYHYFNPYLHFIEIHKNLRDSLYHLPHQLKNHIVLVGCHFVGQDILESVVKLRHRFVVIDYNPEIINHLIQHRIPCIYGDVEDPNILEILNLKEAEIVISTLHNFDDNLHLIKYINTLDEGIITLMISEDPKQALELYKSGADYVILTHYVGSQHLSQILDHLYEFEGQIKVQQRYERLKAAYQEYTSLAKDLVLSKSKEQILKIKNKLHDRKKYLGTKIIS